MIFKIVLIEDSANDQNATIRNFREWSQSASIPVQLLCYANGHDFFEHRTEWDNPTCIFLDIDLPSMSGIEIAQQLRRQGVQSDFVFLTAFREYVFEGYSVSAMDYLLKPLTTETLNHSMQRIISKYQSGFFTFRDGNVIVQIPFSSILYFSSSKHYTDIITTDEKCQQRKPISEILSILPEQFVRIHRTLIVNIDHVYRVSQYSVVMSNGEELPISKTFARHLNEVFMQHVF